jgi:uncharacterized protein
MHSLDRNYIACNQTQFSATIRSIMHQELTDEESDDVLRRQLYGHLGCTLPNSRVLVVPVTYAYHDGAILSFSYPGQKIDALRRNPSVCFQVEECLYEGTWRSVIVWGTYEELSGDKQLVAVKTLFASLRRDHGIPLSPLYKPAARAAHQSASAAQGDTEPVFYRIRIEQKTGRHIQYD